MTGALQALLCVGVGIPRVSITDRTVSRHGTSGATASYTLSNDGNAYKNGTTLLERWLNSGSAGDYDAAITQLTGDAVTGADGVWRNLATSVSCSLDAGSTDTLAATVRVDIRDALTLEILDSATITMNASGGGPGGP